MWFDKFWSPAKHSPQVARELIPSAEDRWTILRLTRLTCLSWSYKVHIGLFFYHVRSSSSLLSTFSCSSFSLKVFQQRLLWKVNIKRALFPSFCLVCLRIMKSKYVQDDPSICNYTTSDVKGLDITPGMLFICHAIAPYLQFQQSYQNAPQQCLEDWSGQRHLMRAWESLLRLR